MTRNKPHFERPLQLQVRVSVKTDERQVSVPVRNAVHALFALLLRKCAMTLTEGYKALPVYNITKLGVKLQNECLV